jgi:chitinase
MKKLSAVILGVALVLCLTSVASYSQTIPNWAPNTAYAVGALVMYQSIEYKCIQAHTSQVGWEPPNVPALWSPVSGAPTPTPTPTATPTPTPTATPTPTPPPGGGGSCAPAWNSTLAYCNTSTTTCNGGNKASKNGLNFTAQFWNQGQDPTVAGHAGPAGSGDPWFTGVACTNGTPAPTPTPTATPTPVS